jgi:hypothetical protein
LKGRLANGRSDEYDLKWQVVIACGFKTASRDVSEEHHGG